jgi:hypothetical protein
MPISLGEKTLEMFYLGQHSFNYTSTFFTTLCCQSIHLKIDKVWILRWSYWSCLKQFYDKHGLLGIQISVWCTLIIAHAGADGGCKTQQKLRDGNKW